jgi:pimeloyl-ACP methyl ester carboxylesterase
LHRLLALAVCVAIACSVAGGCGGSSNAVETGLQRRLLTVADLPAGWSAAPGAGTGTGTGVAGGCLSRPKSTKPGGAPATVAFVQGRELPTFGESLSASQHPQRDWNKATLELTRCHSATVTIAGHSTAASIRRLAFPAVATNSSAYRWTFTILDLTIDVDLVIFTTGRYVGEASYADIGPPQKPAVAAFIRAAVATAAGTPTPVTGVVSFASAPERVAHTARGNVGYQMIGHGLPLLLIMGYSGTTRTWDPRFVDSLGQRFTVIAMNNAGIGDTKALPSPLSIDAMANQSSDLIHTLGLGKTDVLGWSMGGMIAQALAVLHPGQVSHLVLCATFPGTGTVPPSQSAIQALTSGEQAATKVLFPDDQTAAASAYFAAVTRYPAGPTVASTTVSAQAEASKAWFDGRDPAGQRTSSITAPALVADGSNDLLDLVANDHRIVGLLPRSKLLLYPDAGHAFLFQDAHTFLPAIETFLDAAKADGG